MIAPHNSKGRRGTVASLGELLGGARTVNTGGRTFAPVRRRSYHAGDRRAQVWRPIAETNREARRIISARLKAAESYDRRHKEAGKKNGPLGHVGLEVLRELYRLVDFKTGRLDPAIHTVCQALRRSRAAVVAAMARLKEHGFLDWVRRTEPTDNAGVGPQLRQISNAYFFDLPKHAADWVKRKLGPAPTPDDELQRAATDKAEIRAMVDSLPVGKFLENVVTDPHLLESLKRLAAAREKNSASSLSGQNPASEEYYDERT